MAVVVFDRNLKVIHANDRADELLGLSDYIDASLASRTDQKVWQGWTERLKSAISGAQTCTFDEVGYTRNNRTRLLRITFTPLRTAKDSKFSGGIIVAEDMTEQVTVQRQLADTERLAGIGKLASKVAHELNNPMDGILRYINLAMRMVEQANLEKPAEYLAQSRRGLMRMVQIVSELLEFSRSTRASLEYVKIEQLIEDALRTTESQAETLGVRILRDYNAGTQKVRGSSLFQVFCNLARNALDAMPQGGELRISTRRQGKDTIAIEFRDTGAGFASENAETLFEPFFTTKERNKGTGLGLAICRDIVESYDGQITAQNAPEIGSIFTVLLPATGTTEGNL